MSKYYITMRAILFFVLIIYFCLTPLPKTANNSYFIAFIHGSQSREIPTIFSRDYYMVSRGPLLYLIIVSIVGHGWLPSQSEFNALQKNTIECITFSTCKYGNIFQYF